MCILCINHVKYTLGEQETKENCQMWKKKLLSIELHFLKYISSNVVCIFFSIAKMQTKSQKKKKQQSAPTIRCWEFLIEFEMKHLIAFVDANIETLQLMLQNLLSRDIQTSHLEQMWDWLCL